MDELKHVASITPILVLLVGLQFGFIRWLVNREFKRIEQNLAEHEQILFGSKENPVSNPGLISEFRLMAERQKTLVEDVSEIKARLETLPERIVQEINKINEG